jgi:oligoendopeptidase F
MHEFGHTVEQTISLHDVDYYTLHGVPNTAFTEALAFVFQKRDLDVLGMKETNPEKEYLQTLDNLWSCYEIMGVSMVDIRLWKWLYEHPDATPVQVKEAVISIAKDVWNQFFAESFGKKDEPILAIYSHMIDNPLYLSAYPMGHLIEFQLEKQLKGKDFAAEIQRIFSQGRLIPDLWLKNATGEGLSVKPLLESSREALNYFQNK